VLPGDWKAKPRTIEPIVRAQRINTTTKPGFDGDETLRQAWRVLISIRPEHCEYSREMIMAKPVYPVAFRR